MKTKVEEYLEKERISYEALTFNQTELNDFQKILKQKQIDQNSVCKTLVLKGDKTGVIIAVVPLSEHLDYKKPGKFLVITKSVFPEWIL